MNWGLFRALAPNDETHVGLNFVTFNEELEGAPPPPDGCVVTYNVDTNYSQITWRSKGFSYTVNVSTMRGNCGVANLSGIDAYPDEIWDHLTAVLKWCGYTQMTLGVVNPNRVRDLTARGWTKFSEFVNRRTNRTCYLFIKGLT